MSFLIFIILSIILIIGFYFGRQKNISIMLNFAKHLEELVKPEDKEYQWIGGIAGFKAKFKKRGFKRIEITFTLLPRHSLLFLPFSYLFFKGDRIFIVIEPINHFKKEWHLLNKKVPEPIKRRKWKIFKKINGFIFLGNDYTHRIEELVKYKEIKHISISKNIFYGYILRRKRTKEIMKHIFNTLEHYL